MNAIRPPFWFPEFQGQAFRQGLPQVPEPLFLCFLRRPEDSPAFEPFFPLCPVQPRRRHPDPALPRRS